MRPMSLRLKGFKGIKAGIGLDEVIMNCESLPAGIIAFSARNGGGKTTIMDNMHPYRLMPYRMNGRDSSYKPSAFSYYEQVDGDAEKEFIFEVDEVTYRSVVLIDGARKKQEAYLYHWAHGDPGKWILERGIDGKLDNYDQAVEKIMGSPELFFTSVFRAQNAKALSDYAKGDIKELFTELLCIENLKIIGEKARRIKQHLAGKTETLMFDRSRLKGIVDGEEVKRGELDAVTRRIGTAEKDLDGLQSQAFDVQMAVNECDVKIGMETERAEQKEKVEKDLVAKEAAKEELKTEKKTKADELYDKIVQLNTKITSAEELAGKRGNVQKYIDARAAFETDLAEAKVNLSTVGGQIDKLTDEINKAQATEASIKDLEHSLEKINLEHKTKIDLATKTLEDARKDAKRLEGTPCSEETAAGCRFVKDALTAKKSIPTLEKELETALQSDPRVVELKTKIGTLKATLPDKAALQKLLTERKASKTKWEGDITTLETKLSNAQKALNILPRIEIAEESLPGLRKDKETLEAEKDREEAKIGEKIEALDLEIADLTMDLIDLTETGETQTQKKAVLLETAETIKGKIETITVQKEADSKTIGAIEQALADIGKAATELEDVNQKIDYLSGEASQWGILEKAFGNDGIIALELDDAGPQVASIANELLKEYGGRFQVRIDTQIAKADGKGNKETFDISVFDNETNEVKSIRKMSGGEKTWIEDSMTKAIALYLASTSGRKYDATYSDEKDGALDPAKKKEFFAAMRRAMELGGYRNLYCITQTPELQAMADAVIRLEQGRVEVITN